MLSAFLQLVWNEWFPIITSIVLMSLFMIIRKHFDPIVTIILWVFNTAYVATVDYALAATPFALYYCGDNETYEPIATWIHLFLYPPCSFLFLYFYDKWNIRGMKLALYIAGWTCFSTVFEWVNVQVGLFTYTGWKLYYSIPTYPISSLIIIWLYHFIVKRVHELREIQNKPV